jgi:PucR family transcriptional regulator, purine catabolism regulatory protein
MPLYTPEKMGVTVADLLELPGLGLKLVAGKAGVDDGITWAHSSDLLDPTPWLSGGEMLLTTGMNLEHSPPSQRVYVKRLIDAGVSGLGFGVGFGFEAAPLGIVEEADANDFPVVEVPYPVPFIAITKAVFNRLAQDRLREAQASVEVQDRFCSLVAQGSGPADLLEEVVGLAGGWAMLFNLKGRVLAAAAATSAVPPLPEEVWGSLPFELARREGPRAISESGPQGSRIGLPVKVGKRAEAVLVLGREGRIEQPVRMIVHHAVTILALLLSSRRAIVQAEQRVAGDVLSDAYSGLLTGADLERRLALIGFSNDMKPTALVIDSGRELGDSCLAELQWFVEGGLTARSITARVGVLGGRVVALVDGEEVEGIAASLLHELEEASDELGIPAGILRVGVGMAVDPVNIRHSYLLALFALRAAQPGRRVGSQADLGSYGLLLGAQPRPALEGFVRSLLGPLIDRDEARSSDLMASLRAYLRAGGHWEEGARALGVHRHTLRYRVRRVEELLGRNLSDAEDRLELWLALKAAEVLEE